MSNLPCKKTAVGSNFEDAEIAGLQNSERLKGKFYKETLRPKTEEKKKRNQTTSTMGMYVNYAIIQPSAQDINNKKNNNNSNYSTMIATTTTNG
jgi:hypothetical protein